MLGARVDFLYRADMLLLKDVENRLKESELSASAVLQNEMSIFYPGLFSNYYRLVFDYARAHGIPLRSAAEKYRLARRAMLFSRLRQQRRVLRQWLALRARACLNSAGSGVQSTNLQQINRSSQLQALLIATRDKYLKRRAFRQWRAEAGYAAVKHRNERWGARAVAADMEKRIYLRSVKQAFQGLHYVYDLQLSQSKRLRFALQRACSERAGRTLQRVFVFWHRAASDRRLRYAMAAALFLRVQKHFLRRAFGALLAKYRHTRRALYASGKNGAMLTPRYRIVLRMSLLALQTRLYQDAQKGALLLQISNAKTQILAFYALKQAQFRRLRARQIAEHRERAIYYRALFAILQAARQPSFLAARERSYRGILDLRLYIRVFRCMRQLSIAYSKAKLFFFRANEISARAALTALRETSWMMRLHRKCQAQWGRRRGVFQPASGRTGDVLKLCLNAMFQTAGTAPGALISAGGDAEGSQGTTTSSTMPAHAKANIFQFQVQRRQQDATKDCFMAWKQYVESARLINLRLMQLQDAWENRVKRIALENLRYACASAKSEVRAAERQLSALVARAFRMLRQAMAIKQLSRKLASELSTTSVLDIFRAWAQLVPLAKMLQRARLELQLQGVRDYEMRQFDALPLGQQLEMLLEKFGNLLGSEMRDFLDFGRELLAEMCVGGRNQTGRQPGSMLADKLRRTSGGFAGMEVNKYYKELFRLGDFDHFGAQWARLRAFAAQRLVQTAFSEMRLRVTVLCANGHLVSGYHEMNVLLGAFTIWRQSVAMLRLAEQFSAQLTRQKYWRAIALAIQLLRLRDAADGFYAGMLLSNAFLALLACWTAKRHKRQAALIAVTFATKNYVSRAFRAWRSATRYSLRLKQAACLCDQRLRVKAINCLISKHNQYQLTSAELEQITQREYKKTCNVAFTELRKLARELCADRKLACVADEHCRKRVLPFFQAWRAALARRERLSRLEAALARAHAGRVQREVLRWLSLAVKLRGFEYYLKTRHIVNAFGAWLAAVVRSRKSVADWRRSEYFCEARIQRSVFSDMRAVSALLCTKKRNTALAIKIGDYQRLGRCFRQMRYIYAKFAALDGVSADFCAQKRTRKAIRAAMRRFSECRAAELQLADLHLIRLGREAFSGLKEQLPVVQNESRALMEKAVKRWAFGRIQQYKLKVLDNEARIRLLTRLTAQRRMFLNLQLLWRKALLRAELAARHQETYLKRRAFESWRKALARLGFYNYNPNERLKRALAEWRRISRENAVQRHLEVRAERFARTSATRRIFAAWRAYCGVGGEEDSW